MNKKPVISRPVYGDDWAARGACRGTAEPDAFFPERRVHARTASRICLGCDVQIQCLAYAEANGESWGVWGGKFFGGKKSYDPRSIPDGYTATCRNDQCGATFHPVTWQQRFCSDDCRHVNHVNRTRERRATARRRREMAA